MAEIPNLKINQRSNVKRPILRVTRTVNKIWEHEVVEVHLYRRTNIRMCKIANGKKYEIYENSNDSQVMPSNSRIASIKDFSKIISPKLDILKLLCKEMAPNSATIQIGFKT